MHHAPAGPSSSVLAMALRSQIDRRLGAQERVMYGYMLADLHHQGAIQPLESRPNSELTLP